MPSDIEASLVRWFKLTSYEARAYLALLSGVRTPKDISRRGKIPLTRVYDVLKSLEDKGFVIIGHDKIHPIKPKDALANRIIQLNREYEAEKKEREKMAERISSLIKIEERESGETRIELIRGVEAILSKMLEVCRESKDIIFTIRKSFKIKESVKPLLLTIKNTDTKNITFIIDEEIKLDEEDIRFINIIGAKTYRCKVLLDMLLADSHETIIGVPTSSDNAIAIWIKDQEFTTSIANSLLKELT